MNLDAKSAPRSVRKRYAVETFERQHCQEPGMFVTVVTITRRLGMNEQMESLHVFILCRIFLQQDTPKITPCSLPTDISFWTISDTCFDDC